MRDVSDAHGRAVINSPEEKRLRRYLLLLFVLHAFLHFAVLVWPIVATTQSGVRVLTPSFLAGAVWFVLGVPFSVYLLLWVAAVIALALRRRRTRRLMGEAGFR